MRTISQLASIILALWAQGVSAGPADVLAGARPLFTIPVSLQSDLEYYDGLTPGQAADMFMEKHGLQSRSNAPAVRQQLEYIVTQAIQKAQGDSAVVFRMPIQIEGRGEVMFSLKSGQTVQVAVQEFLSKNGLAQDVGSQLVQAVQSRLSENQQQQQSQPQALVRIPVNIGDSQLDLVHYYGQNVYDEVEAFLRRNSAASEQEIPSLKAQLSSLVLTRLGAARQNRHEQRLNQQPSRHLELPVTLSESDSGKIYLYDNEKLSDAVISFVFEYGLNTAPDAEALAQQLLAEAQKRAASWSQMATPLFQLSVDLNGQLVPLSYPRGATPEEAVNNFLAQNGLQNAPNVASVREQLLALVNQQIDRLLKQQQQQLQGDQQQLQEQRTQETQEQGTSESGEGANEGSADEVFTLPLKFGDKIYEMQYRRGATVTQLAEGFCSETWEAVRDVLAGVPNAPTDANQCAEWVSEVIAETLSNRAGANEEADGQPAAKPLLFSLNVTVQDGNVVPFNVYEGDVAEDAARNFCVANGLDEGAHLPALMDAIQQQVSAA